MGIGHAFGTLLLILPFLLIRRLEGLDSVCRLGGSDGWGRFGFDRLVCGQNARSVTFTTTLTCMHMTTLAHGDGSNVHQHMHVHLKPTPHPHPGDLSRHHHGPLFVGALHGVAGNGALGGLYLPRAGVRSCDWLFGRLFAGGLITMVCLASRWTGWSETWVLAPCKSLSLWSGGPS